MKVTNTAGIVYNRAHHAKPRDPVRRWRPGGHDHVESSGQIECVDGGDGTRGAFGDRGGRAGLRRARNYSDGGRPRLLRRGGYIPAERRRWSGSERKSSGPGFGCIRSETRGRAGRFSEKVLLLSGGNETGDRGDQRSGGGVLFLKIFLHALAFRF